mgnify:CR=1 FL=1
MPKVSIIMPSLNVRPYIEECMDSVVNQTLRDLEILCVDAGSTDGTLEILRAYAQKDPRVKVIVSDRKSYGYQMNLGFDRARGEYLGIVETDDFADPDMFETLYNQAIQDDADVVKGGFYYYWSAPEERDEPCPIASEIMCGRVFCPTTDFDSPMEQAEFFNIKPTIWSAVYKADFIRNNDIRFHETPGASFQDASFNFKVWTMARRVRLMQDCFLHYRQDNETSSINSPGKVFCVCDEYEEMERFLCAHPEKKGKMEGIRSRLKYDSYMWNFERLSEELQDEFIVRASEEYNNDMRRGYIEPQYFPQYKWNTLILIMEDYRKFAADKRSGQLMTRNIPGGALGQRIYSGMQCVKEHGFSYTVELGLLRLMGKEP